MNDKELVKHCMCGCMYLEAECPNCNKVSDADRIEELEWLRDALVKKVQGLTNLLDDQFGTPCEQIRHKQEIEALTAKVKLMDDLDVINGEKIEALTAEREFFEEEWVSAVDKLNKAVEALTFYADFHENPNDGPWGVSSQDFGKHARTTLAEIEGKTPYGLEGEKG
jgi:hypothetical protein